MPSPPDQPVSPASERLVVFTIGHSNQPMERLLELLEQHGIRVLADVRSQPYSRYVPHFNRPELEEAVERRGIQYLYLGEALGGRPVGDEFYDDAGYVLYGRVAEAPFFRKGIERLEDVAAESTVALLCSEEDPTNCHRRLLIGRVLAREGVVVKHIRGDRTLQEEHKLEPQAPAATQPSLFGGVEEGETGKGTGEWKSIRPVSPRRPPSSSSRRSDEWESGDW